MQPLTPTQEQQTHRNEVMVRILEHVRENKVIKLPKFDPEKSRPSERYALITVGLESDEFSGSIGPYRYQFEGEEDLLHLIVTRIDEGEISTREGQSVAGFVLRGLPPSLIWLRPGEYSQHFYFGHDELLNQVEVV